MCERTFLLTLVMLLCSLQSGHGRKVNCRLHLQHFNQFTLISEYVILYDKRLCSFNFIGLVNCEIPDFQEQIEI